MLNRLFNEQHIQIITAKNNLRYFRVRGEFSFALKTKIK